MRISIAYVTARKQPQWEWFVDSLCAQVPDDVLADTDILFIDRHAWGENPPKGDSVPLACDAKRAAELASIVRGRFKYRHLPPLPNPYQGPYRLTARDWFHAGVNRNTAIVAARGDYLMFCDDLCVPAPTWFASVQIGAEHGWLLAGMYRKQKQLRVENGLLVRCEDYPAGCDSRWGHGRDDSPVRWHGSAVYGCSFGAPLANLLAVDGNGMECWGQGGEDYDLGIRLERSGCIVMLDRRCLTIESEEHHHTEQSLPRERQEVRESELPANYDRYLMPNEGEKRMSDHVVLNRLANERTRFTPLFPNHLAELRQAYQTTGMVSVPTEPTCDWRTGRPLKEM